MDLIPKTIPTLPPAPIALAPYLVHKHSKHYTLIEHLCPTCLQRLYSKSENRCPNCNQEIKWE